MTPLLQPVDTYTTSRPALRVECVGTGWGLRALRPQWNELLHASAGDHPFLTWEWLHPWWTHLGDSPALKVITVRDATDLIALAPLRVVPHVIPGFSRLEFLGTGYAGSDYLDLIVRPGREDGAINALAGFLGNLGMTVRLDHVPAESCSTRLAERLGSDGWFASITPDGMCPVIPLAGHTWESYLSTLGASHRANVRRRLRAIERQFTVRFERVISEAGRLAALAALNAFHRRRFDADGGSTAFMTPAVRAFQDEATRRALDRDRLRMYVLRLDGEIAAVMYGFLCNRRFYFYQHGFDEQHAHRSVGLVLIALTIRAAIDEEAHEFDLLWGNEGYKSLWAREAQQLRRIHLFPPHAVGRMHRRVVEARRRLAALVQRFRPSGEHREALA